MSRRADGSMSTSVRSFYFSVLNERYQPPGCKLNADFELIA